MPAAETADYVRAGAPLPAALSSSRQHFEEMARGETTKRFPAISVRQPNADRIIAGKLRHDARSRRTRFRGWILLHASRTFRRNGPSKVDAAAPELGKLLGIVELADCVSDGDGWKYVWKNPRRFRSPIACRGHYSIPFYVPAKLVAGTAASRCSPGKPKD
jgi:hypothetical protein